MVLSRFGSAVLASWIGFAVLRSGLAADSRVAPLTPAPASGGAGYVIWKLDDLRGVAPNFQRVVDWLAAHGMKAGIGIICNSLETADPAYVGWIKRHAVENGGHVEFWHHGYDHGQVKTEEGKSRTTEFMGTDLAYQREHLERSCGLMKARTGLVFHTFGAPFNATDQNTEKALAAIPELKVWLYGRPMAGKLVLGRSFGLESTPGKVFAYEEFLKVYEARKKTEYVVLQGHPAMWSPGIVCRLRTYRRKASSRRLEVRQP